MLCYFIEGRISDKQSSVRIDDGNLVYLLSFGSPSFELRERWQGKAKVSMCPLGAALGAAFVTLGIVG